MFDVNHWKSRFASDSRVHCATRTRWKQNDGLRVPHKRLLTIRTLVNSSVLLYHRHLRLAVVGLSCSALWCSRRRCAVVALAGRFLVPASSEGASGRRLPRRLLTDTADADDVGEINKTFGFVRNGHRLLTLPEVDRTASLPVPFPLPVDTRYRAPRIFIPFPPPRSGRSSGSGASFDDKPWEPRMASRKC